MAAEVITKSYKCIKNDISDIINCEKCKKQLQVDSKFCSECGTKVSVIDKKTGDGKCNFQELMKTPLGFYYIYEKNGLSDCKYTEIFRSGDLLGQSHHKFSKLYNLARPVNIGMEAVGFYMDSLHYLFVNSDKMNLLPGTNDVNDKQSNIYCVGSTRENLAQNKFLRLKKFGIRHLCGSTKQKFIFKAVLIELIKERIADPCCLSNLEFNFKVNGKSLSSSGSVQILSEAIVTIEPYIGNTQNYTKSGKVAANRNLNFLEYNNQFDFNDNPKEQNETLHKLLDQLPDKLYFSETKEILYTEEEIINITKAAAKYMYLDWDKHTEKFKLKHCTIYIFNKEAEDLIDLLILKNKTNNVLEKFQLVEGMSKDQVSKELF